ncbi:MAG: DnaJ domain-containing protein [Pseudomonadota bacterium]
MQERRNYYRLLQVQPDAPVDVIRTNYRTLLQKCAMHPDLGGSDRGAAALNLAWQTLRDPQQRAEYDRELLARYSVQVVGQGGADRLGQAPPASEGENRRNLYRVLQVQRDASAPIIEASYRALLDQATADELAQLEAAYAVLGDPGRRRAYDTATRLSEPLPRDEGSTYAPPSVTRRRPEHESWSLDDQLPARACSGYAPLIVRYCAFCKTPHAQGLSDTQCEHRCVVCESPLSAPPGAADSPATGRDAVRLDWDSQVSLRLDWPGPAVPATVCDFSPHGALVACDAPLDVGAVVRLEGASVCAVSEVVHRRDADAVPDDGPARAGLKFLTARFEHTRGTFVCAEA